MLAFTLQCMIWNLMDLARKYAKNPRAYEENMRFKKLYSTAKMAKIVLTVKLQVVGQDDLPTTTVLYVPNHKSSFDPLAVFMAVYKKKNVPMVTFVAKKELQESRIAKAALTLMDGFFLDRADPRQAVEVMENVKKTLTGYRIEDQVFTPKSVCVFPEGHRYPEDEFGEFKGGAFSPAYKAFKPIVPVAIINSRGLIDKTPDSKKKRLNRQVKVVFLKKLDPQGFFTVTSDITANRVRKLVIERFKEG